MRQIPALCKFLNLRNCPRSTRKLLEVECVKTFLSLVNFVFNVLQKSVQKSKKS